MVVVREARGELIVTCHMPRAARSLWRGPVSTAAAPLRTTWPQVGRCSGALFKTLVSGFIGKHYR